MALADLFKNKNKLPEETPAAQIVTPEEAPAKPEEKVPVPAEPSQEQTKEKKKKARTRPQDYTKLTRNSQVKIRLTEEEVDKLKGAAAAAGMNLADFVMAGVDQSRVIVIPGAGQIWEELNRQGNNLNQALKICHLARLEGRESDIDAVIRAANRVEEAAIGLIDLKGKWDADISQEVKKDADRQV